MIPLGILESSKKESKRHIRVEVHPFDSNEVENAANNICLCETNSTRCVIKPRKNKVIKVKKVKRKK